MSPKPLPLRTETMKIFDLRESKRSKAVWFWANLAAALVPLALGLALAWIWRSAAVDGQAPRVDFLSRISLPALAALTFINLYSRSLHRSRPAPALMSLAFLWLAAVEASSFLAAVFGPRPGLFGEQGLVLMSLTGLGMAVLLVLGSRLSGSRTGVGLRGPIVLGTGLLLPWAILASGEASALLTPGLVSIAALLLVIAAWRLFLSYRVDYEPLRLALVLVALGCAGAQVMLFLARPEEVTITLFAVRATLIAATLSPLFTLIFEDLQVVRRSLPAQLRVSCNTVIFVVLMAIILSVGQAGRADTNTLQIADQQRSALLISFVVLACTSLAMQLAILACRRFLDNVESLVDATRKLAQGKLESLVTQKGSTELAALTGAFNAMAERVFLQTRELRILARVMDGTSDPVLVLDPSLHIVYANDAFAAKTGWARVATIGRSFRDLFIGDDAARKLDEIQEDVEAGESWAGELVVRTQSAGRLESFVTVSPVVHKGQIVQYVAVHRDLSALKRLESERLAFADNLVRLHKVTQNLVRSLDLSEIIQRAVAGLREHFGIAARVWLVGGGDRCSECSFADLCAARDRGPCLTLPKTTTRMPLDFGCAGQAAQTADSFVNLDASEGEELLAGEPESLHLAGLRAAYPLVEDGDVRGVLELGIPDKEHGRVLDSMKLLAEVLAQAIANARLHQQLRSQTDFLEVTTRDLRNVVETQSNQAEELREANVKLIEADRLRTTFLSTTSHELRTPISGMMGYLRLILDGLTEDHEEELQFIRESHDLAQKLLDVINDVLDIAKIDSGRVKVASSPIDVEEVLAEIHSSVEEAVQAKGLAFEVAPVAENLIVHADHDRLIQILGVLVNNAVKFSHEGRIRVTAAVSEGSGFVEFRVADQGIGLDPEEFERVLEPFVQADAGDRRLFGGNGLGLTLARDLLSLMGGNLHLESDGIGAGVTAVARVPIGARIDEAGPQGEADGKGSVVVLADSDPEFIALAREVILDHGGRIQVVSTAAAAFEAARLLHPDFMLAEFSLPHDAHPRLRTGVDLARELEDSREFQSTFILTTALDPAMAPLGSALSAVPGLKVASKPTTSLELERLLGLTPAEHETEPETNYRVLLVDDDQSTSEVVVAALAGTCFQLDYAQRGDEAIAGLLQSEEPYDVLLIDLLLPGMSLYEILETISGRERFNDLAVVALVQSGDAVTGIQDLVSLNDMVVGAVTKKSLTAAPHVLARSMREAITARRRPAVAS